jgi:hypothetical protein
MRDDGCVAALEPARRAGRALSSGSQHLQRFDPVTAGQAQPVPGVCLRQPGAYLGHDCVRRRRARRRRRAAARMGRPAGRVPPGPAAARAGGEREHTGVRESRENIGAAVMGRNLFGPVSGGAWGDGQWTTPATRPQPPRGSVTLPPPVAPREREGRRPAAAARGRSRWSAARHLLPVLGRAAHRSRFSGPGDGSGFSRPV